jgi:hypothetical protein
MQAQVKAWLAEPAGKTPAGKTPGKKATGTKAGKKAGGATRTRR